MELTAFRAGDAAAIASWPTSEEEARAWCGRAQAGFAEWHRDPDVTPYVLRDGDEPVAYGEVWQDGDDVELARLIVRPDRRNAGVGRSLVRKLLDRAGSRVSFVRVVPENAAALACYRGAGFRPVPAPDAARFNAAQPRAYAWLRRSPDAT